LEDDGYNINWNKSTYECEMVITLNYKNLLLSSRITYWLALELGIEFF